MFAGRALIRAPEVTSTVRISGGCEAMNDPDPLRRTMRPSPPSIFNASLAVVLDTPYVSTISGSLGIRDPGPPKLPAMI